MPSGRIYLSVSTDAVDASLVTKDLAIKTFTSRVGVPLSRVAGIGDSANDLPFLKIPGLGLAGAPSNAQVAVKQALRTIRGSYISKKSVLDGFLDFYSKCSDAGIEFVFSDRDGVLIWKGDAEEKARLKQLLETMGQQSRPFIFILTGSSYEQNIEFMGNYKLDSSLGANQRIRENPYIIYAENGAVQIDILTSKSRDDAVSVDQDLLAALKGDFLQCLLRRIKENILPVFGLELSDQRSDQRSKLYLPPKKSMVTVNVPRTHMGLEDYRRSPQSDRLRQALLKAMILTAKEHGLPYQVLE